jgi:hypothetical protein
MATPASDKFGCGQEITHNRFPRHHPGVNLDALLRQQSGLATRHQLRGCNVSGSYVRAQLTARRWQELNDIVICTHNGPLTERQSWWAAVLTAQPPVGLCSLTAMQYWDITGFPTPTVHILVVRGARVLPLAGVDVAIHESRRFTARDILPRLPPVTGIERSIVDAAVWSADIKTATRVIAAPIQQRRTSAMRLREELEAAGMVRFRRILLPFIADLEGGAAALSEVAFLRWCRRHGFPKPHTQVRLDNLGRRRYLDAAFRATNGSTTYVEIDGGIHLTLATRWADTAKDNDAVIANQRTLRFPSVAIYSDDPRAVAQLRAALGTCQNVAPL